MKKFFSIFLTCITSLLFIVGCSTDDVTPDMPSGPTTEGDDPVGTIILEMNNENEGRAMIGNGLYIDSNNNFHCQRGYITSYGKVNGLAFVNTIPTNGWVSELKVSPGYGYLYYNNTQYFRIYVVDYRYSLGNTIIGATVKYQSPFYGVDEEIVLDVNSLDFPSEGTTNTPSLEEGIVNYYELPFANSNTVVFSTRIEPDDAKNWLTVDTYSTTDFSFIANGLKIYVKPTDSPEKSTANIVLKTGYDKITTLAITRSGREPFIEFDEKNSYIAEDGKYIVSNNGGARTIRVSSNIPFDNISCSSNSDWCTIEFEDEANKVSSRVAALHNQSRATTNSDIHSYVLKMSFEQNNGAQREGTITLSSTSDHVTSRLVVLQESATLEIPESYQEIYCTRQAYNTNFDIITSIKNKNIEVKSNAKWCEVSMVGNTLRIRIEENPQNGFNRKATITFPGFDATVIIDQSKYAEGDEYSEGAIKGIVSYMKGADRYIRSENLGEAQWSTESVVIAAKNLEDGYENYIAVSTISNWRTLYPAFALVADLNTNGVSGWILPAYNQAVFVNMYNNFWTSTEYNSTRAYSKSGTYSKSSYLPVYAIHKF